MAVSRCQSRGFLMPSSRRGPVCLPAKQLSKTDCEHRQAAGWKQKLIPTIIYAWHLNSEKSGSVNYEGACSFSPEEQNKTKRKPDSPNSTGARDPRKALCAMKCAFQTAQDANIMLRRSTALEWAWLRRAPSVLHPLIIKCRESKTNQMVRSDSLTDDGRCQEHSLSSAANKSCTKWLLPAISLQMNVMLFDVAACGIIQYS